MKKMSKYEYFTLHLKCNCPRCMNDKHYQIECVFISTERNASAICRKRARAQGWIIKKDGRCFAPRHAPNEQIA